MFRYLSKITDFVVKGDYFMCDFIVPRVLKVNLIPFYVADSQATVTNEHLHDLKAILLELQNPLKPVILHENFLVN